MKKIIMAGALAAAILPLMAMGAAGAATSLPPGPAIYPGSRGALEHVTPGAPAEIYTPWGVITDEYAPGRRSRRSGAAHTTGSRSRTPAGPRTHLRMSS